MRYIYIDLSEYFSCNFQVSSFEYNIIISSWINYCKRKEFFSFFFLILFSRENITSFHAWITISNDTVYENGNKCKNINRNRKVVSQWKAIRNRIGNVVSLRLSILEQNSIADFNMEKWRLVRKWRRSQACSIFIRAVNEAH